MTKKIVITIWLERSKEYWIGKKKDKKERKKDIRNYEKYEDKDGTKESKRNEIIHRGPSFGLSIHRTPYICDRMKAAEGGKQKGIKHKNGQIISLYHLNSNCSSILVYAKQCRD